MENLKLTRIDFRLIHGQVMTRWVKKYNTETIVVIDDRSATSPLLKKILLGMAPSGVDVRVETIESAVKKWNENDLLSGSSMILFKNTETALRAWEAGVKFPSLQVGGIEGAGDKKNIYKNVVMSKHEAEQLEKLGAGGVHVFFQPIPEDNEYSLKDALAKF
ncbi:MAG: PTS sugar transporter subunit IIB [Bacilli bacterium]